MNAKTALVTVLLVAVVAIGGLGAFHFGMDMDATGSMSGCPLMGMTAVCPMDPLQHLEMWQSLLVSVPGMNTTLTLLLSLLAFFVGLAVLGKIPIRTILFTPKAIHYAKRGYIPFSHPLQELFSSGILNPKVF